MEKESPSRDKGKKIQNERSRKVPHQAVIAIQAEIMENLQDGRVSGIPKKMINKLHSISGTSYEDCLQKTNELIERLTK
jgi:hypothetical protein